MFPVLVNGCIITLKNKSYLYETIDTITITINDLSCIFITKNFGNDLSDIVRTINFFINIIATVNKLIINKTMFYIKCQNTFLSGEFANYNKQIIANIENVSLCEKCGQQLDKELNKYNDVVDCCSEISFDKKNNLIYKSCIYDMKYENKVFSGFLKNSLFNRFSKNPIILFLHLSMVYNTNISQNIMRSISNFPIIDKIKLPVIKNNEDYHKIPKEIKKMINMQIFFYDNFRFSIKIPIVLSTNTVALISKELVFDKNDPCCGINNFIEICNLQNIERQHKFSHILLNIDTNKYKNRLTKQEISHYNYIIKVLKKELTSWYK